MRKYLSHFVSILFFLITVLSSCNKDNTGAESALAYQMLGDKIWYLEYTQTNTNSSTVSKTYVGQSTYYIEFLNDHTTKDSDGLIGTYTVAKSGSQLQIFVTAKLTSGIASNYTYEVLSLGANNMVLFINNGNTTTNYYYSTLK
jgi:hypothetical protein